MLPLVITVEQVDGGVRRYAFADSPVSIGRSPFAELQLSEPFISRWEGTLRFDEREITYFSLGSTNLTQLDGHSITGEEDITLGSESVLTLGELTLRFTREPVAEADLRRKGKRRPMRDNADTGVKTVYLDAAEAWSLAPPSAAERSAPALAVLQACAASSAPDPLPGLGSLRQSYREARAALIVEVRARLAALPDAERKGFLTTLSRTEPSLSSEPELQLELQRAGVSTPSDIPELREWLRAIKSDLLPEDVHFDSQLTLTRVLGLLEALIQSLAEIHDAQESVRRRWLGRSSRRSVLQSDKGNIVLAYLLNPHVDWNERLRELEQSVRDVVTHELALFRATLEGARTLVHALSPEVVTQAEQSDGDEPPAGFWTRIVCKNAGDIGLWRRFLALHSELADGARYERIFLGRVFARSYLAAMGQPDTAQP
jgi:predicted component of type VI protein secretion system